MVNKKYALVRFINGEDAKKYSVGVPVDMIKNFDLDRFHNDDYEPLETFVVEWRDAKKKPRRGWPLYDVHVIKVSDRISVLERHLRVLEGAKSPRTVPDAALEDTRSKAIIFDEDDMITPKASNKRSHDASIPLKFKNKKQKMMDENKENLDDSNNSIFRGQDDNPSSPLVFSDSESEEYDPLIYTNKEAITLEDIFTVVKDIHKEVTEIKDKFVQLENILPSTSGIQTKRPQYGQSKSSFINSNVQRTQTSNVFNAHELTDDRYEGKLEVGAVGSGLVIDVMQWTAAVSKGTYTAMATSLLKSLVPLKILIKSNWKGGANKLKGKLPEGEEAPRYQAIKEHIRQAILYSTRRMYPKTFNEAQVGVSINNCLNTLRGLAKTNPEAAARAVDSDTD